MKISPLTLHLATAGVFCLMTLSSGANLTSNGSFETGDFTGWNPLISGPFTVVDGGPSGPNLLLPQDGNYYALFGDATTDTISQMLTTSPGTTYDLNFWVNDKYGNSSLLVQWNGATVLQLGGAYSSAIAGQVDNGWVDFNFPVVASSSATVLSFSGASQTGLGLDNVSVPDQSGLGIFLSAVGGLMAIDGWRRRSRQVAA